MDRIYIIKFKVTFILDIRKPIATWILARLFDEDTPIPRKDLLRNLCQASFDSMLADTDFSQTINNLLNARYIEESEKEYTNFVPVKDNSSGHTAHGTNTNRTRQVTQKIQGYIITEEGIIAFRKQIGTPLEKIQPHLNLFTGSASRFDKFKKIIESIKNKSNVLVPAVKLCIENAPLVLEFLQEAQQVLTSHGIPISF